jgi:diguanylate cyclase (GGDEF)-like protein
MCVAMVAYGRSQRTYPGYWLWFACHGAVLLTTVLLALRGTIPDVLSIVLALSIGVLAAVLRMAGSSWFIRDRGIHPAYYLAPALALALFAYYTFVQDSALVRTLVFAAAIAPFLFGVAWLMAQPDAHRDSLRWLMTGLALLYGIAIVAHAIAWMVSPEERGVFASTAMNELFYVTHFLIEIGWTATFLLLNSQRTNRELRDAQRQLEQLARTDDLTKLANRRMFMQVGEQELVRTRRYGRPMCLAMIDVDHLKATNDGYGHAAGDRLLREVATACRGCLRETDTLARLGGDEFALVLPETDRQGAAQVMERLADAVATHAGAWHEPPLAAGISYGLAEVSEGDADLDALISRADDALYAMKRARGQLRGAPTATDAPAQT